MKKKKPKQQRVRREKPIEFYDDVLAQEPQLKTLKDVNGKEYKDWEKRLYSSLGFVVPMNTARFFLNNKGKPCSSPEQEKIIWSVCVGKECHQDFESQENAEIMAEVVQVNERLKRVENLFAIHLCKETIDARRKCKW